MSLYRKLNRILSKIQEYSCEPNGIYLYPLNEYIKELRRYFNYESSNDKFNGYIREILLPGFDSYVEICERETSPKINEEDVRIIKEGVLYRNSHFKSAFTVFKVDVIDE